MTIQEVEDYLDKHYFLVFDYKSRCYSLKKENSLFKSVYSLIDTNLLIQQYNSMEELCEKAFVCNNIRLNEIVEHIKIRKPDDLFWETYEAVKHCAIVHGNEIHFLYNGRKYWIAHIHNGFSHLSDDLENTQYFESCRDLFENALIDNKNLKEIWGDVVVDAC